MRYFHRNNSLRVKALLPQGILSHMFILNCANLDLVSDRLPPPPHKLMQSNSLHMQLYIILEVFIQGIILYNLGQAFSKHWPTDDLYL